LLLKLFRSAELNNLADDSNTASSNVLTLVADDYDDEDDDLEESTSSLSKSILRSSYFLNDIDKVFISVDEQSVGNPLSARGSTTSTLSSTILSSYNSVTTANSQPIMRGILVDSSKDRKKKGTKQSSFMEGMEDLDQERFVRFGK